MVEPFALIIGKAALSALRKRRADNGVPEKSESTFRVTERGRDEERLGDDPPVRYDNRSGGSEQHYTLKASRQWRRQVSITFEKSQGVTSTAGINVAVPHLTASIQQAVTEALKESYSATEEKVESFEQSIDLTVPPHTLVLVTLSWKRIWQNGVVEISAQGDALRIPFRSLAGVAFDVRTVSELSPT
jgi:hypothetical protein